MKGTEKQIAWAEDIKKNALDYLMSNIMCLVHQINEMNASDEINDHTLGDRIHGKCLIARKAVYADLRDTFAKIDDAATIINKRNILCEDSLLGTIHKMQTLVDNPQYFDRMASKAATVEIEG